jgi:hypothetical protein
MTTQVLQQTPGGKPNNRGRCSTARSAAIIAITFAAFALSASPALAEEPHPPIEHTGFETETFTNPNGIAVEESTDDVYVADVGTDTVYKFDANGNPVNFNFPVGSHEAAGNALKGADTPAGSFAFPNEPDNPAAIAVDNSTNPADPSAGDLYVMDAGHDAIDKFNSKGEYRNQIKGPFSGELVGLGVDGEGNVRVDTSNAVDVFDNGVENDYVTVLNVNHDSPLSPERGFAAGPRGDDYMLTSPCGCMEKVGGNLEELGQVDSGPEDVAAAVDPLTGHLYVDEQSSVAEWDTGGMNGAYPNSLEPVSSAALVSSFGSAQLASSPEHQGGIAVNGASGRIYVSDPAAGKVYVYGTAVPGVAADVAANVTETSATLTGSVDPHGLPVSECRFEYEASGSSEADLMEPVTEFGHSVECDQTPAEIESGTSPVAVSADIGELAPGVLYHVRLVAANANGSNKSDGLFATAGPGFGIKPGGFEVAFLNPDGTPDTQAGSHPYEMVANIDFNTQVLPREATADSVYGTQPDGNVKDVITDLPPGLVGDPNATAKKCTLRQLETPATNDKGGGYCPAQSQVGELEVEFGFGGVTPVKEPVYNMAAPHGVAAQLGANFIIPKSFINAGLMAGGDYPLQATSIGVPAVEPIISIRETEFGVVGGGEHPEEVKRRKEEEEKGLTPPPLDPKPFLSLPTGCTGPLSSSIYVDSYQHPGSLLADGQPNLSDPNWVKASTLTHNAAGETVTLSGCSKLEFPPTIEVKPDVPDASTSTGLTVNVHVSQKAAFNPTGLAESALRDTTVTLPEGVAINPSTANGLEVCSENLAGFEIGRGVNGSGFEEFNPKFEPGVKTATFTPASLESLQPGVSFCPDGSKIGTVKIKTPLLEHELEGSVYLATENANPFGSLVAMYLMVEDPISGSTIKLTGEVSLNPDTGQISTTFENTPDLPFENLELHFFGGERAPLTTPSRCGTYTTQASFVPWDGNAPVNTSSSFQITSGPNGSPCPGASLPFNPSLTGGATNVNAGAFSPFTLTMTRKDGEQNLQSVEAHLPPGLSGILSNIELCPEPQANVGECGPNSLIGETTVSVGVGGDPFTVSGGKFYLTGPYNGSGACTVGTQGCAPFGITFEVPAKAGPFDLERNSANPAGEDACDCVLVRGKIEVNPLTAALTITSNPPGTPDAIPTSIEGIPLEIQHINAITTRGNFQFNPTNCSKMEVTGTIHSNEGGLDTIGVPFQVTNCAALKFEPKLSVSTSGKTSKAKGASLTAKVTVPNVPQGTDADIAKVKVDLPKQLPSRLTTLQKACTAKQFEANPAGCPAESKIGSAVVHTPILPVALVGPAIFVSHGGEAFPSLTMVLQGDGVTIDLVGTTFISKAGITSTTFKTVPDQPFSTFELTLPEGPYSALAANGNLCALTTTVTVKKKETIKVNGRKKTVTRKVKQTKPESLVMPTAFVAQNGAEIHENTAIGVTGCKKAAIKKAAKKGKKKGKKKKK